MTEISTPPPLDDWAETDRRIEEKKKQIAEGQGARASEWSAELDILMGRVAGSARDVEYIDLDTGLPQLEATHNTLAMPKWFSRADQDEIEAALQRRSTVVDEISTLLSDPSLDPIMAAFRADELKGELSDISLRLFALLTANPIITVDWLLENREKWRPKDLSLLIARYDQRNAEVVAQIRAFRGRRLRKRMGITPALDGKNMARVGSSKPDGT